MADVICPTWPGTLSLFPRVKRKTRTVVSWLPCACRCQWVCSHPVLCLACYPFFLTASESKLQFYYCPECTCPGRVTRMHCTSLKCLAIIIHPSEATCILMYALVYEKNMERRPEANRVEIEKSGEMHDRKCLSNGAQANFGRASSVRTYNWTYNGLAKLLN